MSLHPPSHRRELVPLAWIYRNKKQPTTKTVTIQESNPMKYMGERVAKYFGEKIYYGTIAGYNNDESPIYWHVEYDDGDKEDMENDELQRASNLAKIQEKLAKRNGSK